MPCSMGWDRSISRGIRRGRLSEERSAAAVPPKSLQHLDLARVVDVVARDPVNERGRIAVALQDSREVRVAQGRNGIAQLAVGRLEHPQVLSPGVLGRRALRAYEEVAPL